MEDTTADGRQYDEFLDNGLRWLHREAKIDHLPRSTVNKFIRFEIGRREGGGRVPDDPQRIWSWVFVGYLFAHGEGGEADA